MLWRNLALGFVSLLFLILTACRHPLKSGADSTQSFASFEFAWRVLRDSYFDTNFNGLNWQAVHDELAPRAAQVRTAAELRPILEDMVARLGHSHMSIIPGNNTPSDLRETASSPEIPTKTPAGLGTLGLKLRLVDSDLLVTGVTPHSSAAKNGVQLGWKLLTIDDSNLPQQISDIHNKPAYQKTDFVAWNLGEHAQRGEVNSTAHVTFLDAADQPQSRDLVRFALPGQPVTLGHFPPVHTTFEHRWLDPSGPKRIGYIHFNFWMIPAARAFDQAIEELKPAQGVIIDMRGNLGGLAAMVMGVAGHFVTNRQDLGVMLTRENQLHFYAFPRTVNPAGDGTIPYTGPVAILTDGNSASAAELFAGGMQAIGRARIFGQESAGQALPATFTQLPNRDLLYHAFANFLLPDGRRLEANGVRPDEVIPLRRADLIAGRDATLEAAVQWIQKLQP